LDAIPYHYIINQESIETETSANAANFWTVFTRWQQTKSYSPRSWASITYQNFSQINLTFSVIPLW